MTCSVCGLTNGAHLRECIDRLIVVNNQVLAKCINRAYYQLEMIVTKRTLDYSAIVEAMRKIREELDDLRVLNSEEPRDIEAITIAT